MQWNRSVLVLYTVLLQSHRLTEVTCTDIAVASSARYTSYIIVCTAISFILHQTNASAAGWSLSALYLHGAHRHETRMTGWVCSCFCSHVYIKHHNFGVPVLTLSHILDITDIVGQWYTDMWYQSYQSIVIRIKFYS